MNLLIQNFFRRFEPHISEDAYSAMCLEDYQIFHTNCDYLDYDLKSLFRKGKQQPCGLRNIGNTCYFNVILQVLFHIKELRELVIQAEVDQKASPYLGRLRRLFLRMYLGKLVFVDPRQLFEALTSAHPEVFEPGVQNDFQEVFMVMLGDLEAALNPEQKCKLKNLIYGNMKTTIDYKKGKTQNLSSFSIINLPVAAQNFDRAIANCYNYRISDYLTKEGIIMEAVAEVQFVETPALLAFFINRVGYKEGKMVKDRRKFEFEDKIFIVKHHTSLRMQSKIGCQKEMQIQDKIDQLKTDIQKMIGDVKEIDNVVKYLKQKKSTKQTQLSKELECTAKYAPEYLCWESQQLRAHIKQAEGQIKVLEKQIEKINQKNQADPYLLWAVIVHEGDSPHSGHYKALINTAEGIWIQFDDRNITTVTQATILDYKESGQVCCLFYRLKSLACISNKTPMSKILKDRTILQENQILEQIDKARLLQSLHQQYQHASIKYEKEARHQSRNPYLYFFKLLDFMQEKKLPANSIKGALAYQMMKKEEVMNQITKRLINSQVKLSLPVMSFGLPPEYNQLSEIFAQFLFNQSTTLFIDLTYEKMASKVSQVVINDTLVRRLFQDMLKIFISKGTFYLGMLSEFPSEQKSFQGLNKAIQKLMMLIDVNSEFYLRYFSIQDCICSKNKQYCKNPKANNRKVRFKLPGKKQNLRQHEVSNYFLDKFSYWIGRVNDLSRIDETILYIDKQIWRNYITELNPNQTLM